jgi:hypothetical protein
MIESGWEGKVQFYELAFGTWIAYLFLVFIWKRIFKVDHEGWRYALITLVGGSFYIINHYFLRAPFYYPLINTYSIVFFVVYYLILVKPLKLPFIKKSTAFLSSSILYSIVYILGENLARFLAEGRLIPGVHIPEFLFLVTSFLAGVFITLSFRKHS